MADLERLTREELIEAYEQIQKDSDQPFSMKTLPYYSTAVLEGEVIYPDTDNGWAYLIFRAQTLNWFDYGIGTRITYAADTAHKATRADTNLSKANSTNGAFDFCIEELSMHCRNPLVAMATPSSLGVGFEITDPSLLKALSGMGEIFDPTAIVIPQQFGSPFFAGNVLWAAVKNSVSVAITFDAQNYRELGTMSYFALGAEAHPHGNDSPVPDDLALAIKEGLLWAKDGEPDSDLTLRGTLHSPVVVPISAIEHPLIAGANVLPTHVYLPIVATFRGLEIGLPSSNG